MLDARLHKCFCKKSRKRFIPPRKGVLTSKEGLSFSKPSKLQEQEEQRAVHPLPSPVSGRRTRPPLPSRPPFASDVRGEDSWPPPIGGKHRLGPIKIYEPFNLGDFFPLILWAICFDYFICFDLMNANHIRSHPKIKGCV